MDILNHKNLTIEDSITFEDLPEWFQEANTCDAHVTFEFNKIKWHTGTWHNGTWNDGVWLVGYWEDGVWLSGTWHTGTWSGGTWHDGIWIFGYWEDGVWCKGTWKDGTWGKGIFIKGSHKNQPLHGFDSKGEMIL